jgi:hypothetical protein
MCVGGGREKEREREVLDNMMEHHVVNNARNVGATGMEFRAGTSTDRFWWQILNSSG